MRPKIHIPLRRRITGREYDPRSRIVEEFPRRGTELAHHDMDDHPIATPLANKVPEGLREYRESPPLEQDPGRIRDKATLAQARRQTHGQRS